jgi:predicted unusual protein kinase regulating ubiquinone biosynthesis (AarF/ABC1/UbiB family)
MLQLAGQYFDLPPEDATVFEDAYDNVRGQTRVQALRVLKREARLHPEAAELLDNIEQFGQRIGGGSLMTVYDVQLKDGRRVALSVKNPNVEYNLDKMTTILERSVKHVQAAHPDSPVYPALEAILGQVKQWIRDELEDPEFELKDARFRLQNDDTLRGTEEAVSILVPNTIPTGTRRIRCEEYIEGTNLNGLEIADTTDIGNGQIMRGDLQLIVSKLVKNYVPQLLVHGLAHPDIHPGNFRVMNDARTIAVFDRYNLLELDDHEKTIIGTMAAQLVAGDANAAADELLGYLQGLPENAGKERTFAELRQEFGTAGTGGVSGLMTMLVKLQQASVVVPLKLTLVARNFGSLNKLSLKAGFSGVAEALMA